MMRNEEMIKNPEELVANLAHFTGSEYLYSHWLQCLQYTDGVKYLAKEAEANWLIDAIASYQYSPQVRKDSMLRDFQLWILATDLQAQSAVLSCYRDTRKSGSLVAPSL